MERRNFLKFSTLSLFGLFTARLNNLPVFASASKDKILVLVELKGGNDGLNTVIPFTEEKYYKLRPQIAIPSENVIKLSDSLGLNPAMEAMKNIWDANQLGIVLGVGYPNPNRSHFRSIEIWETGSDSQEVLHDGWISRVFAKNNSKKPIDGIIIGQGDEGPLSGNDMNNLVMNNPEQFVKDAKKFKKLATNTNNSALAHILKVDTELYQSSDLIEKKISVMPNIKKPFPQNAIGKQFESATRIIGSDIPVNVIKLEHGSFDTHSNQRNQQDRLLRELSESLNTFREAMIELGKWDNILVMTYSEFGRRVGQNGSNGTDHGTASPHFVIGGKVKGGFYGKQPDLDDLEQGDLKYHVDYRSMYATVTKKWWGSSVEFLVKYPTLDFIA